METDYQQGYYDGADTAKHDVATGLGLVSEGLAWVREAVTTARQRRDATAAFADEFPARYEAACAQLAYQVGMARGYRGLAR